MRLIQILLPTHDNDGNPFPQASYAAVRAEITDAFGGVTAYVRAPAAGLWDEGERVVRDDIIIYEAMVERFDTAWWQEYRGTLERRFEQEEIVIRALPMERI